MWWKRRKSDECIYVVTGKNCGPILDSVFPSDVDYHPILYFLLDKNALHLNVVNGPVTIYSSLLEKPIKGVNIFDAFTELDKEIGLKLSRNKAAIRFEFRLIFDSISIDQSGKSLLNFSTDRGEIQIEIPNGEVTIWYTTLPTEAITGKNIIVAFRRFHRRIGYKRNC